MLHTDFDTKRKIPLRQKYAEKGLTSENFAIYVRVVSEALREFASRVEISPGYMCDLENEHRDPPSTEVLEKISLIVS